ncbi:MAG: U32 family peptidase [Clostridia bacterium]|nr:U32 family peptidase [Clostridia bacterium]
MDKKQTVNYPLPEILAPAGDFERLNTAIYYGADAVYLGSDKFGMRSSAASFKDELLKDACDFAHSHGVKVYLTCNVIPHNKDLKVLPEFLEYANYSGVDALIVTDLGVMISALKYSPDLQIHISTQAGVTNYETASHLYNLGAKRIVLARELSIDEISEIRAKTPPELEIECFVHGAMCVSFSGRCLLSNYLTGRDSNMGDCAQPCRWNYSLVEEKRPGQYFPISVDSSGTYILNSRDMCMIEHIPDLYYAGVNSFKIEGRAKSAYYTAVTVNAYKSAVKSFGLSGFSRDFAVDKWISEEVLKASNREYCTGFFYDSPAENANIYYGGGYIRNWDVVAIAEKWENGVLYATQRNRFFEGDELEVMLKGKPPFAIKVINLKNEESELIDNAPHPMMKLSFDCEAEIPAGSYLRKIRN